MPNRQDDAQRHGSANAAGTAGRPIADYGLLSDCQGAALVSREGSIDWACLPRFDSAASFARLLGPEGGHWSITAAGVEAVQREYLDGTMVLRTCLRTAAGATVVLTDALSLGPDERGHHIGHGSPHVLLRVVEVTGGDAAVELELAIRPEYGLTVPVLEQIDGGVRARGGPLAYLLSSSEPLELDGGIARANLPLRAGDRRVFALQAAPAWQETPAAEPG